LIADAHRLADIPGMIVHGRYDVVTPVKIAFDLARNWPRAKLRVVPDAGHAMTEPGIVHELVAATKAFAD
jgi:proline iminopeptidase